MKGNTFCCLATITKIDIEEVDTEDGVSCNLRYAPMHKTRMRKYASQLIKRMKVIYQVTA